MLLSCPYTLKDDAIHRETVHEYNIAHKWTPPTTKMMVPDLGWTLNNASDEPHSISNCYTECAFQVIFTVTSPERLEAFAILHVCCGWLSPHALLVDVNGRKFEVCVGESGWVVCNEFGLAAER